MSSPDRVFKRCAFGLEDVVREHVSDSARSFAFETTKKVVEFERAREETQHLLLYEGVFKEKDLAQEYAKAKELPRVEEITPTVVVVAACLVGVVPVSDIKGGKRKLFGEKASLRFSKKSTILRTCGEVDLFAIFAKSHDGIESVAWG